MLKKVRETEEIKEVRKMSINELFEKCDKQKEVLEEAKKRIAKISEKHPPKWFVFFMHHREKIPRKLKKTVQEKKKKILLREER